MKNKPTTPEEYIQQLPEDKQTPILKIRKAILNSIPKGFQEELNYGMIGYVVPHSIYPAGYHCDTKLPLPFINLAAQKNSISLYHMGIYANTELMNWFVKEYPKHSTQKLDMGKSCIRFKNMEQIPFELIGELCSKISVEQWIAIYESELKK